MKDFFAAAKYLVLDMASTLFFLALFLLTHNTLLSVSLGVALGVVQIGLQLIRGKQVATMEWLSLFLIIAAGGTTLYTNDPRFVLIKPSIGHFAIGTIMLRRNWMMRYMPEIVRQTAPDLILGAGYLWAALMFVLGAGTVATALTGDMKLWTFYVTVVLVGAKLAAFAIQYVVFRVLVRRRIRAQIAAGGTVPAAVAAQ